MSSWLELLIRETDFVETPKQWIYWSGLATISAVVSPNVIVEKGAYQLKPNLFVLLIGRSGLGKGFGPSLSKKLVGMVNNTRIISGRGSIEGILKELSIVRAQENGGIPFKDARGYLCSGEFASSLYEASHALTILTDLYDGHYNPSWDNTLKNSPIEKLRSPCLTLLSGANQNMFDLTVDKSHMGGGFVGRTLLIGAEKRFRSNSMIYEDGEEPDKIDYDNLASYLKELALLKGTMKWSKEAKRVYNAWFYPYRDAEYDDNTGTYDRLNDHVIKIATCISLSRKLDMMIEDEDIEEAIAVASSLSNTAKKVAGMQGKSSAAAIIKSFLLLMVNAEGYTLTRKQVLQKGFGNLDASELDKVIETLTQTGFVVQLTGGKEIKYQLTKTCVEWWLKSTRKES
jgi:predicted transcriptional regulator